MNLLLLSDEDFLPDGTARIEGRRLRHARDVLRVQPGEVLKVGRRGGNLGRATIVEITSTHLRLEVVLDTPPPPRAGVDLLLAIPRPKALKKVLPAVASLGVDRVVLLNAARVEKSYFDSHVLEPGELSRLFELGLEQAADTRAPTLLVRERFRPFVEDEVDALFGADTARLLAHPSAPRGLGELPAAPRRVVAIGPEGGWVPFELELMASKGFRSFHVGPRPFRVEIAVPYVLGALAHA